MRQLWGCLVALLVFGIARAETLPVGTRIPVRVRAEISSTHSEIGSTVQAVVIAAVPSDDHAALSPGVLINGTIRAIRKQDSGQPDRIQITFDQIRKPSQQQPLALTAKIVDIDNARERIEADGWIYGLKPLRVQPSKKEYLLMAAAYAHPLLLASFESARLLRKELDKPTIHYPAGVDMTLELVKPLDVSALTGPAGVNSGTSAAETEFTDLVARQPLRTQAGGAISDQTNLLFIGTADQLDAAFAKAGWKLAASRGMHSDFRTFLAMFERSGYTAEPVSTLTLDGRTPDRVYEKQTNTIAKRHHIRIWQQSEGFHGAPVWIGAATHDVGITFSRSTRNVTHRVEPNVDLERAKILDDLRFTGLVDRFALTPRPAAAREFRNATGDHLVSDGRMAVIVFLRESAQGRRSHFPGLQNDCTLSAPRDSELSDTPRAPASHQISCLAA